MSKERQVQNLRSIATLRLTQSVFATAFALAVLASCGGGGGSSSPPPSNNPVPSITGLSPASATVGAAAQTLTINGTNFMSSSTVTYNSVAHTATYVSSTQLTISLSASDQATAGSFAVVVTNPSPGGGASNSVNFTVNDPVPTITSLSPSSATAGASAQNLTINGTNFLSGSTVTYDSAAHPATVVSSTQLTISLSASDQATAGSYAVVVTNPSPGGGPSNSVNFLVGTAVTAVGSLVMVATPAAGGPATGDWTVAVAAVDSTGKGIANLLVTLNTTSGTISPEQGLTDSTGTLMTSVSPPSSYSGEAVAVSALGGGRTAVVNIAFVASSASTSSIVPSLSSRRKASESAESPSADSTTLTTPFLYGTGVPSGASNPFSNPNLCYSNSDLSTTVTSSCQSVYSQNAVQQSAPNIANTVCNAVSLAAGVGSCLGTTAIVASCLASETGIGLAICAGTVQYVGVLGPECVGFLADELATHLTNNPDAASAIDVVTFDPASANPTDIVGLICDVATGIGSGTGSSGVQVTIKPVSAEILTGADLQFGATVGNSTNTAVTWSVNGGVAGFGSISTSGLYTAPSVLPSPDYPITVTATSTADQTAKANAVVTIAATPTLSSIAPTSAPAGSPSLTLSLIGSNFVSDSIVNFSGTPLPTTFVDWSDLTAVLPATDLVNAGVFPVTVSNPDTQGAISGAVNFTVTSSSNQGTVASLSFNPTFISAGASTTGTVTLSVAAPTTGAVVSLSSDNSSALPVPAQVTIPAGSTTANFTAPSSSSVTIPTQVSVTAAYDNSYQSATVTVSPPGVVISPSSAAVSLNGTQQFTANVTGMSNTAVNWAIDNIAGGDAAVGTISTGGLYTAPGAVPNPATVTVTATSQATPSASASASVTITTLPYNFIALTYTGNSLFGGTWAYAINGGGEVVGVYGPDLSAESGDWGAGGFLYAGSTYTVIEYPGTVDFQPCGSFASQGAQGTAALDINNSGQIVGAYSDCSNNNAVSYFLYSGGVFSPISYPGASGGTTASHINNAGEIVGSYTDSSGVTHGFSYAGVTFSSINYPGATSTQALGINDSGQIVGSYTDLSGDIHGFLYTGGSFSALDYHGATSTTASLINNSGQIVGTYTDSSGATHGFLYAGGNFTSIDYPSATSTAPSGINNSGQIVGTYTDSSGVRHGFLYAAGNFISIDYPGATGSFTSPSGINDSGQIVGSYAPLSMELGNLGVNGFLATPQP